MGWSVSAKQARRRAAWVAYFNGRSAVSGRRGKPGHGGGLGLDADGRQQDGRGQDGRGSRTAADRTGASQDRED